MRWLLPLLFVPALARAHEPVPNRLLVLQLRERRIEGLLTVRVPAERAAMLLALPPGSIAERLARVPLKIDGHAPKLVTSRAVRLPDGAIESRVLLDAGHPGASLHLKADLPVRVVAPTGMFLQIVEGAGRAVRGGVEAFPRRGAPVTIRIERRRASPPRTRSPGSS